MVIGAAVGGVLGGLLLVVIVIIIVLLAVWCTRRRSKYQLSEKTNIELGTVRPLKPIIGGGRSNCSVYTMYMHVLIAMFS